MILTSGYDAAGDRTSLSATIDSADDFANGYTFDALHRLTRVDQIGQSGGSSVAEKRVDFAYNALGQFTETSRYKDTAGGNGNLVLKSSYTYDVFNRRIAKEVDTASPFDMQDAVAERYVYDSFVRWNSFSSSWTVRLM